MADSGWATSTRARRLPGNWKQTTRRILDRDGHTCRIRLDGCTGTATQVDHIQPGDNHTDTNLRAACAHCNARMNIITRPRRASIHRPPERHPGLR